MSILSGGAADVICVSSPIFAVERPVVWVHSQFTFLLGYVEVLNKKNRKKEEFKKMQEQITYHGLEMNGYKNALVSAVRFSALMVPKIESRLVNSDSFFLVRTKKI